MFKHFFKIALRTILRFKLHSLISFFSLVFGFLCFVSATLLLNYTNSFDQQFPNASRTYNVVQILLGQNIGLRDTPIMPKPAAAYLRAEFPEFEYAVRATLLTEANVTIDGQTDLFAVQYVETGFLNIFPLEMLSGIPENTNLPPNSALITEEAAIRHFGHTDVLGQRIILDQLFEVAIVGVTKKFTRPSHLGSAISPLSTDLIVPIEIHDRIQEPRLAALYSDMSADQWGDQFYFVYVQFSPDVTVDVEEFNTRLDAFVKNTVPPLFTENSTYALQPINELVTSQLAIATGGFDITSILLFAGTLVLFIGCLNYSNFVFAQLSMRGKEIGIQKTLGATRGNLLLQYSFETFLFVIAALMVTILILYWSLYEFGSLGLIGVSPELMLDVPMWLVIAVITFVIVGMAGTYPALRAVSGDLVSLMRPGQPVKYRRRPRGLMVVFQFCISGTLIILSMLMFSQNTVMTQQLDSGDVDPKIVINNRLNVLPVDSESLATELENHAAIVSTTKSDVIPWSIITPTIDLSRSPDLTTSTTGFNNQTVGYDFFDVFEVPFLAGRDFSRDRVNDVFPSISDITTTGGPYAIVIDIASVMSLGWETAEDAVGQTVFRHFRPPYVRESVAIEQTVVGVVDYQKSQFIDYTSVGLGGNVYTLGPENANYMIVRVSRQNIGEALAHIDEVWSRFLPEFPLRRQYADDLFYQTYQLFLAISMAIGVFAIFGFVIASIGLLGNATFSVNVRQKEVGIRKVLGASSMRLLLMLFMSFAKPVLFANAIAWPLGYVLATGYLSLFATRTEITFLPFAVSLILTILITLIAVISQIWKTSQLAPISVLRYE